MRFFAEAKERIGANWRAAAARRDGNNYPAQTLTWIDPYDSLWSETDTLMCRLAQAPPELISFPRAQFRDGGETQSAVGLQAHRTQWTARRKSLGKLRKVRYFGLVSN
jgi:hypothetical protein